MLFQYFFTLKATQILSLFIDKENCSSPKITYKQSLVTWKTLFHLHRHFERIFSILQFTRLLDSIGLCWFSALCSSKLARHIYYFIFFSTWVFFHEHSRFTGQQGKGEGIYLTPLYHFHPLHRHLDISRAITAESSPLHIAGSRTRTGNLWFPSASR